MKTCRISNLPGEAGVTVPCALDGRPFSGTKQRVNIFALGSVGSTMLLGLRLLGADVISSIGICDMNQNNADRLEMEINQVRYPFGPALPPVEIIDRSRLFLGDVVLFCASKGVPPLGAAGDVRMAQLAANRELIRPFAREAAQAGYRGMVGILSDPVDLLCAAFLDASGLPPQQVQGFGLGVMNARAAYYAERNPQFSVYLKEGRAFGPHGEGLVLADSLEHYDDRRSRELTRLAVSANLKVRELGYKPYIAPALSSAALSLLLMLRGEWHYSSVYLGDKERGAFWGVKNRFTEQGLEYEDSELCAPLYGRIRESYLDLCRLRGAAGGEDGILPSRH